ncbi:PEP-CTERM sorting domain-containing protein [Algisphaera agarilytica]|uniref:PEP-CTERM protein-sorting domain-containing protein n=1 Tax=Algisphaera agarilytica TaxID=1385975 RepID=A0A7X0HAL7_9BACT|nr:PEP-CTERM sorting domain-containing protein [Algisphaera agarilytica]MBB6431196.1 hypothetical protein [Algisphaera agarilytica]
MFGSAQAQLVVDINNPMDYTIQEIIDGGGLRVGDKVFDEFEIVSTGTTGITLPDADSVKVKGGVDSEGNIELEFFGGWVAGTNELINSTIEFCVTADSPFLIEAVELSMQNFAAFGQGQVNIAENIFLDEDETIIGIAPPFLNTFYEGNSGTLVNLDTATVVPGPQSKLYVSKDITVRDLSDGQSPSAAHLSRFTQTFIQIPEPGTVVLFLSGGALLMMRRREA